MNTAPKIEHLGTDRENNRELYILELANPDELPASFETAGRFFTALIVWDACNVARETISRFARRLIDLGGVYFCAWGPDCERVHDIIDQVWVGDGFDPTSDQTLMTTWHNYESLANAIWFAVYTAFPISAYFDECRSVVAICIDCPQWAAEIRSAFTDPEQFSVRLLGPEE